MKKAAQYHTLHTQYCIYSRNVQNIESSPNPAV